MFSCLDSELTPQCFERLDSVMPWEPGPLKPTALLAAIVESSPDAIVSKDLDGIITSWNTGAERMFGYSSKEIVGRSILTIIPADRRHEEDHFLAEVRQGRRINSYDTIRQRKDGRFLHVSLSISPVIDSDRNIIGAAKIARDISNLKITQQTQALLLRELNHRSKNLLAVADAIVRQTAKKTPPKELVSRVSCRLHALSVNQDLLIERDWHGAELQQVILSQLGALIDDTNVRLSIEGPAIVVSPGAAQAVGLAIFELGTNALKFGSLSIPEGRVEISWQVSKANDEEEFALTWRELGGPRPKRPKYRGFGSTVIEGMVARSLLGQASLDFDRAGVIWTLVAPTSSMVSQR